MKVGRLRKENEATLAASIARIERNLEDKVDNMHKHDVTVNQEQPRVETSKYKTCFPPKI